MFQHGQNFMMNIEIGQVVTIQSYKHDGSIHRTWLNSRVLDVQANYVVLINNRTWVIEADGRRWFTREPAIGFFFEDRWFNVIAMIRKTGITYYCNLASPSLFDGEAVKHIDYDLDVKVLPDGTEILLDEDEYESHGQSMGYSEEMKLIIENNLNKLYEAIRMKAYPFQYDVIESYFQQYLSLKRSK
jgi:uncharacterized protein